MTVASLEKILVAKEEKGRNKHAFRRNYMEELRKCISDRELWNVLIEKRVHLLNKID
jgi:hypothetical protein